MSKVKNYFKAHKIISVILAIAVISAIFVATSYIVEKTRCDKVVDDYKNNGILVQTKFELDNREHKLEIKTPDKNTAEYDSHIIDSDKFLADKVKTETHTIRTDISKNEIWNKFKHIDTEIKISCVDTTAPEFTEEVDTITINKGEELDVASKFKATDLSGDVEIKVDGDVDVNTVGEQTVNVFATDKSGNVAQTEVKVVVNEPENSADETATKVASADKSSAVNKESNSSSNTTPKKQTTSQQKNSTKSSSANNNSQSSSKSNSSTSNKKKNTTSSSKPASSKNDTPTTTNCANGKHSMPTGNCGKWFNSRAEAIKYYNNVANMWNDKYDAGEITFDQLCKNAPGGYECWSCSHCGKWTLNFKYFS